jgi:hypothetical protein
MSTDGKLKSDMSKEELEKYFREFRLSSDEAIFSVFVDNLEHFSWNSLKEKSGSDLRWKDVTSLLFQGEFSPSIIFKVQVMAVVTADREQQREKNSRVSKTESRKRALDKFLQEKHAGDKANAIMDTESGQKKPASPKKLMTQEQFQRMFKAPGKGDHISDIVIVVNWPKDLLSSHPLSSGSELYRRVVDEPDVFKKMIGWIPFPFKGIIEASSNPLLHESFVLRRAWRFKISSVAQQLLADRYEVAVHTLSHSKVNHTHFISTVSAACKQVDKLKKAQARLERAAISRNESQLKEAQKAECETLADARSRALDPLKKKEEQAFIDLREAIEENADEDNSIAEVDAKARLRAAKSDILRTGATYDDLSSQLLRKHALQLADLQASEAASKDFKRARVGLREAPNRVRSSSSSSKPSTTEAVEVPTHVSEVSPGTNFGDATCASPSTPATTTHPISPSDSSLTSFANNVLPAPNLIAPAPLLEVCPKGADERHAANPFSGFHW